MSRRQRVMVGVCVLIAVLGVAFFIFGYFALGDAHGGFTAMITAYGLVAGVGCLCGLAVAVFEWIDRGSDGP